MFSIWEIAVVGRKGPGKARREIGIARKTAWFMPNRIGEAWTVESAGLFSSPAEVDETCIGGRRKNMPEAKRNALSGRDGVGKSIVAGTKDRATKRIGAAMVGDRARARVRVNDIERFGSLLKRVCTGTFRHIPARHLRRCVAEFAG